MCSNKLLKFRKACQLCGSNCHRITSDGTRHAKKGMSKHYTKRIRTGKKYFFLKSWHKIRQKSKAYYAKLYFESGLHVYVFTIHLALLCIIFQYISCPYLFSFFVCAPLFSSLLFIPPAVPLCLLCCVCRRLPAYMRLECIRATIFCTVCTPRQTRQPYIVGRIDAEGRV